MDNIETMTHVLYKEMAPLYEQLHAYVRRKLIQLYPGRGIDPKGPIPAHILGGLSSPCSKVVRHLRKSCGCCCCCCSSSSFLFPSPAYFFVLRHHFFASSSTFFFNNYLFFVFSFFVFSLCQSQCFCGVIFYMASG